MYSPWPSSVQYTHQNLFSLRFKEKVVGAQRSLGLVLWLLLACALDGNAVGRLVIVHRGSASNGHGWRFMVIAAAWDITITVGFFEHLLCGCKQHDSGLDDEDDALLITRKPFRNDKSR